MSLRNPSHVSATMGYANQPSVNTLVPLVRWFFTSHARYASRTTPTLCVLVIMTGPSRNPDSSTQVVPVISPFPFSENHPAKTELPMPFLPRKNCGDTGSDRAFANLEFSFTGNQSGVANKNSRDIGDGVAGTGSAVKRNAEIASARLRFF